MDVWPVFLVAAATFVWTVAAFFIDRRWPSRMSKAQLNQTASITSREQFNKNLQDAIRWCRDDSNESKEIGLILLGKLVIDSAARESDRDLAGKVEASVRKSMQQKSVEGGRNDG